MRSASPAGIVVVWAGDSVVTSWAPVDGATSYEVRCREIDAIWSVSETNHRLEDPPFGDFRICVRAVFGAELGEWSEEVNPPARTAAVVAVAEELEVATSPSPPGGWRRAEARATALVVGIVAVILMGAILVVSVDRCHPISATTPSVSGTLPVAVASGPENTSMQPGPAQPTASAVPVVPSNPPSGTGGAAPTASAEASAELSPPASSTLESSAPDEPDDSLWKFVFATTLSVAAAVVIWRQRGAHA